MSLLTRASEEYFQSESKRTRSIVSIMTTASGRENWTKIMLRFVKDPLSTNIVDLIEKANSRIAEDRMFNFLCMGGRTAIQSLDLLNLPHSFCTFFLRHFALTACAEMTLRGSYDHPACYYGEAMKELVEFNNWTTFIFWRDNDVPANIQSRLAAAKELFDSVKLDLTALAGPARTKAWKLTETHNFGKLLQTHTLSGPVELLHEIFGREKAKANNFLKALDAKLGDRSKVWNPFRAAKTVLNEAYDEARKKLGETLLEVPAILDPDLLDLLSGIGLEKPEFYVELFKQRRIWCKLDFEMMDIQTINPERMPSNIFNHRDFIRLVDAHAKLGLNLLKANLAAMQQKQQQPQGELTVEVPVGS